MDADIFLQVSGSCFKLRGRKNHWLKKLLFKSSWHDMRNTLQGLSMACVHSLTQLDKRRWCLGKGLQAQPHLVVFSHYISQQPQLLHERCLGWCLCLFPSEHVYGAVPNEFDNAFWTCCHWLPQLSLMAANSQSLLPAVERSVLPLLSPFLVVSINFLSFCCCRNGGWPFCLCQIHFIHCLCDHLWAHSPQPFPL